MDNIPHTCAGHAWACAMNPALRNKAPVLGLVIVLLTGMSVFFFKDAMRSSRGGDVKEAEEPAVVDKTPLTATSKTPSTTTPADDQSTKTAPLNFSSVREFWASPRAVRATVIVSAVLVLAAVAGVVAWHLLKVEERSVPMPDQSVMSVVSVASEPSYFERNPWMIGVIVTAILMLAGLIGGAAYYRHIHRFDGVWPYTHITRLHRSEFSQVELVRHVEDGEQYVWKMYRPENPNGHPSATMIESYKNERDILADLNQTKQDHIVRGPTYTGDSMGLCGFCMEYLEKGTLSVFVTAKLTPKLQRDEQLAAYIARSVVKGLKVIHSKGYAHLDIKPANIGVDSRGLVKIMDFGSARKLDRGKCIHCDLTPPYCAPEQLLVEGQENSGSASSDIFSLGMTILAMFVKKVGGTPLSCTSVRWQQFLSGIKDAVPIEFDASDNLRRFLEACLKIDPAARYTVDQLLQTSFLNPAQVASEQMLLEAINARKQAVT